MRVFWRTHFLAIANGGLNGQYAGFVGRGLDRANAKDQFGQFRPIFSQSRTAIMKKAVIALILVMNMSTFTYGSNQNIKEPNVAGQFYPQDPAELSREIETFFQKSAVPFPVPIPVVLRV